MTSVADATYAVFAERLSAGGILRDAWVDGRPRFRPDPVIVDAGRYAALCRAAEARRRRATRWSRCSSRSRGSRTRWA